MTLSLPPKFIATIKNAFGGKGTLFLTRLPALIDEAARKWNLRAIRPVPNLSYNFVAFALRSRPEWSDPKEARSKDEAVLKIGAPNREFTSEIAALRLFDGKGAAKLLDADEARFMFLLERLRPGKTIADMDDDEKATRIAADVMLNLWRPAPREDALIQLSDWLEGFERIRARYENVPFDKRLIDKAESIAKDFIAENHRVVLMHGDLHHFNILSSEGGWLAIDPKGVIGPAAYEVGPFLLNPIGQVLKGKNPKTQIEKRVAVFAERFSFERERIRKWGFVHAVLSACWNLEDGEDFMYAIQCAELF